MHRSARTGHTPPSLYEDGLFGYFSGVEREPGQRSRAFRKEWRRSFRDVHWCGAGNGRHLSVSQESQWNAGLYDDKHSFVWKMAAGLLELLEAKSGERILDLGCGTGHLTSQIAATGAVVVGIDRSTEMIQQAREKYPALRYEVMDARELAFQESFDAVF